MKIFTLSLYLYILECLDIRIFYNNNNNHADAVRVCAICSHLMPHSIITFISIELVDTWMYHHKSLYLGVNTANMCPFNGYLFPNILSSQFITQHFPLLLLLLSFFCISRALYLSFHFKITAI